MLKPQEITMNKRIAIGTILVLGSLLASACNVPFGGEQAEPEAQAPAAEAPDEQAADEQAANEAVSEPTEAPTEEPRGTPIAHLDPDTRILVTHIQMISLERGWGIGGLDGASDHVFRTNDGGQTWKDVTPPEPAPEGENPSISAVGYFLNPMTGWVTYYEETIEPRTGRYRVWGKTDGGDSWTRSRAIDVELIGTTEYPPILGFDYSDNGWQMAWQ